MSLASYETLATIPLRHRWFLTENEWYPNISNTKHSARTQRRGARFLPTYACSLKQNQGQLLSTMHVPRTPSGLAKVMGDDPNSQRNKGQKEICSEPKLTHAPHCTHFIYQAICYTALVFCSGVNLSPRCPDFQEIGKTVSWRALRIPSLEVLPQTDV